MMPIGAPRLVPPGNASLVRLLMGFRVMDPKQPFPKRRALRSRMPPGSPADTPDQGPFGRDFRLTIRPERRAPRASASPRPDRPATPPKLRCELSLNDFLGL